jgi:hypothetical protein
VGTSALPSAAEALISSDVEQVPDREFLVRLRDDPNEHDIGFGNCGSEGG